MSKPRGLYILDTDAFDLIYGPSQREQIGELVDIYAPPQTRESVLQDPSVLADMELLFSAWGPPCLDEMFLQAASNLNTVFYAAGTVRAMMTEAAWDRDVVVTSAYGVNAIPVAEFAFAQVLFCLKLGWQTYDAMNRRHEYGRLPDMPGAFGSTVGIISLGQISRRLCEMLKQLDVRVIAHHPTQRPELAKELNIEFVSLDEIFTESDVISLHAPLLPETEAMITGRHLAAMKQNASFINTARGGLVNEPDMIDVLRKRHDLVAVLDVTVNEPLEPESPLWTLPNAILFPHMAGSWDRETHRMSQCMVDELRRHLAGKPLEWQVTRERAVRLA